MTYSLSGMRHALLQGYSLHELLPEISTLVIFCVILIPLSLSIIRYAVKRVKEEGTLVQY
jgi:ABC-2 type transport system permease protein